MPNGKRSKSLGDQFSEKSDKKDKKIPKKGEDLVKEKRSELKKDVSKDKREQFKEEIIKKKKKRRRRPKKRKESLKESQQKKTEKVEREMVEEDKQKVEKEGKESVEREDQEKRKEKKSKKRRNRKKPKPKEKRPEVEESLEEVPELEEMEQPEDYYEPEQYDEEYNEPEEQPSELEEQPSESEEISPEAPIEPINPFEQEIPEDVEPVEEEVEEPKKQTEKGLPTNQYEEERDEEVEEDTERQEAEAEAEAESEHKKIEEQEIEKEQEPINPFEAAPPQVSTIESKALDAKPLDRKEQEIEEEEKYEVEEPKSAESMEQSAEELNKAPRVDFSEPHGAKSEEQLSEEGAKEENDAADDAEKAEIVETGEVSQGPAEVAEVVNVKKEPIGGAIEPEQVSKVEETAGQTEEFKEEIWDILEQAGITKSRIIKFVVILGVIILFIIFGGLKLFGIGDGGEEKIEKTEVDTGIQTTNQGILPSVSGEGDISGVVSSYVFGLEYTVAKTPIVAVPIGASGTLSGVTAGLYFGEGESDFEARLVYYVDLLRRMDNIYSTDIYALIDMSVDRRAALEKHIDEMADIIDEGDNVFYEIKSRMEGFDKEFETIAEERDISEEEFFLATEELFPRSSYENLQTFVRYSKQATEIKAYYSAYKTIGDILVAYLDLLEPRYQDVVANKEALIKGIRVFDIPSSDIDAILPIEEE